MIHTEPRIPLLQDPSNEITTAIDPKSGTDSAVSLITKKETIVTAAALANVFTGDNLPNGTDLNNWKTPGVFRFNNTIQNGPPCSTSNLVGYLVVHTVHRDPESGTPDGDRVRQLAYPDNVAESTPYTRVCEGGNNWSAWNTLGGNLRRIPLTSNVSIAQINAMYYSFGNFTLGLPSVDQYPLGTKIGLEQYLGTGKVTYLNKEVVTTPDYEIDGVNTQTTNVIGALIYLFEIVIGEDGNKEWRMDVDNNMDGIVNALQKQISEHREPDREITYIFTDAGTAGTATWIAPQDGYLQYTFGVTANAITTSTLTINGTRIFSHGNVATSYPHIPVSKGDTVRLALSPFRTDYGVHLIFSPDEHKMYVREDHISQTLKYTRETDALNLPVAEIAIAQSEVPSRHALHRVERNKIDRQDLRDVGIYEASAWPSTQDGFDFNTAVTQGNWMISGKNLVNAPTYHLKDPSLVGDEGQGILEVLVSDHKGSGDYYISQVIHRFDSGTCWFRAKSGLAGGAWSEWEETFSANYARERGIAPFANNRVNVGPNTLYKQGYYITETSITVPNVKTSDGTSDNETVTGWFGIRVLASRTNASGSENTASQIATLLSSSTARMFIRSEAPGGVWSSWVEVQSVKAFNAFVYTTNVDLARLNNNVIKKMTYQKLIDTGNYLSARLANAGTDLNAYIRQGLYKFEHAPAYNYPGQDNVNAYGTGVPIIKATPGILEVFTYTSVTGPTIHNTAGTGGLLDSEYGYTNNALYPGWQVVQIYRNTDPSQLINYNAIGTATAGRAFTASWIRAYSGSSWSAWERCCNESELFRREPGRFQMRAENVSLAAETLRNVIFNTHMNLEIYVYGTVTIALPDLSAFNQIQTSGGQGWLVKILVSGAVGNCTINFTSGSITYTKNVSVTVANRIQELQFEYFDKKWWLLAVGDPNQ